jgi:class 3 adenylate cyclase
VGTDTGLVVRPVNDLQMEYRHGRCINLAPRMEQTAEPGAVQIGEDL